MLPDLLLYNKVIYFYCAGIGTMIGKEITTGREDVEEIETGTGTGTGTETGRGIGIATA